jgi:acetyl esterase/lipase
VYLHVQGGAGLGGGVVGGLEHADGVCRAIVRQAGCLVVGVEHRLAPEHPFPAGHDDVVAALRWLMSDAAVVGADTRRVAIGGEGIGATMAAAAAIHVRSTGRGPVAIVLVTPMTHPAAAVDPAIAASFPSWHEAADARPMSSAVARWCLGHLVDDPADLDDPRLSLLTLPSTALARFPNTIVITAERDPWCDEGAAFAAALLAAGVEVEHTRYDGVMHGFFSVPEVVDRAAIAQSQVAAALCRAFDPDHLRGLLQATVRARPEMRPVPRPVARTDVRPGADGHAGAFGRTGGLRP